MKNIVVVVCLLLAAATVNAQDKFFTRSGKVTFFSKSDMENIEAVNTKGTSVLDTKTGQLEFAVLLKAFEFEKELMMEHFNENYVESDKYPKSTFKGTVDDISAVNFQKDGVYPIKLKGQFTLHGVTKEVLTDGTIEVKGGKPTGKASFTILLADYNIVVPNVVKDNISKSVKIDIIAAYEKMSL
ncbi:MAG: YceI family protein [Bacteroidota bacterium]